MVNSVDPDQTHGSIEPLGNDCCELVHIGYQIKSTVEPQ